jgi:Uma2 family endonuclease
MLMAAQPRTGMTVEEYLAFERASAEKHEYRDGEIVAMVGASYAHNLIVSSSRYSHLRPRDTLAARSSGTTAASSRYASTY